MIGGERGVPRLSVVVALQQARQPLVACLESLCAQVDPGGTAPELIVVDGSPDGAAAGLVLRYPDVTFLRASKARSLPVLHGIGLAAARGDLVAITEAHCTFAPGWAAAAITAHDATESPAIGGAVEPGEGLRSLDWALYFCDYGQFLSPLVMGPTRDLPGNNVVFKRTVLDRGADLDRCGFWKTFVCQQLAAEGWILLAEPGLVVRYHRRLDLRQLTRRRFLHGRCFGGMRAQRGRPGQRAFYVLTGPLLPWLLLLKLARRVWPKGRYRRRFLLTLPWSIVIVVVWSVGEWVGNLRGPGRSCSVL